MKKAEFLSKVRSRISNLPESDIIKSLDYYDEMISDFMDNGLSEEDAVGEMGTVDDAVAQILTDIPLAKIVKSKVQSSKNSISFAALLLIILGFPLWLPLLIVGFALFITVYAIIFSAVITLYAVDISLAVSAIGGIISAIIVLISGEWMSSLFLAGASFVLGGVAILLFFAFGELARLLLKSAKLPLIWIKSIVVRGKR